MILHGALATAGISPQVCGGFFSGDTWAAGVPCFVTRCEKLQPDLQDLRLCSSNGQNFRRTYDVKMPYCQIIMSRP